MMVRSLVLALTTAVIVMAGAADTFAQQGSRVVTPSTTPKAVEQTTGAVKEAVREGQKAVSGKDGKKPMMDDPAKLGDKKERPSK